jgi:hypothetical protein
MRFRRHAVLLFLVGVLIALVLVWQDGGSPGRGTSGQWEYWNPTCTEAPVLCSTPPERVVRGAIIND